MTAVYLGVEARLVLCFAAHMLRLFVMMTSASLMGCMCGGLDPCASGTGTGTLDLTFVSPPAGASATVTGPSSQTFTSPQSVMLPAGSWTVAGNTVTTADPIVRTVFTATDPGSFCIAPGKTTVVTVSWAKVATSNRLWAGNGSGGTGSLHAFDSASLPSTGSVASSWNADVGGSGAVSFDKQGNLWALGGTTEDPVVLRYPASGFATPTAPRPDRRVNIMGITCGPRASGLAFDKDGNLFVASPCMREVYKLSATSLATATGTDPALLTPTLTLTGFMGTARVAFDQNGNLHVADPGAREVVRFEAAAISGTSATPSVRYRAKASDQPADTTLLGVDALAFDKDGNLFAFDFGSNNVVYFYPAAQLTGTGTKRSFPVHA